MGSGYSKMKKQARAMQEQMGLIQSNLQNKQIEGSSGNGLVLITLNGEKELKKIIINPECLSDAEGLQDLILAAFQDASRKVDEEKPNQSFSF